ncbi:MAG: hypothetical protein GY719_05950 [bacterium]|nr:hypothetical protein [bacterium]
MRLREIHSILVSTFDDLQVELTAQTSKNNMRVSKFHRAIDGTRLILSAGVLQEECKAVLDRKEITDHARSSVVTDASSASKLQSSLNQLKQKAALLIEALGSVLGPDEKDVVAIKIPEHLDLDGVAKVLKDLDGLLAQALVNDYVKGQVSLKGFDRGSEWIMIALGSLAAVHVLGHMVRLHFSMEEKRLDIEARREVVRGMKIKNDSLEDIEQALKEELDLHLQTELESAFKAGKLPKKANEERERIKHSVRELGELLRRGLEVQPSLALPKQSQVLFPQLPGYLKELPALPEKAGEEEDESE